MMNINWSVFTLEQKEIIEALIAKGEVKQISHAIVVQDTEQEYWLQQIVDQIAPEVAPLESKVKSEIAKVNSSINTMIDNPEKEAEWQKKLDEEKAEHIEKEKIKKEKRKRVVKKEEK